MGNTYLHFRLRKRIVLCQELLRIRWIYTWSFDMMSILCIVFELTWCQFFASFMCQSFPHSCKIDLIYHITLFYHPHFGSCQSKTYNKITPPIGFTIRRCIFRHDVNLPISEGAKVWRRRQFFYPILEKSWIHTDGPKVDMSKNPIMSDIVV